MTAHLHIDHARAEILRLVWQEAGDAVTAGDLAAEACGELGTREEIARDLAALCAQGVLLAVPGAGGEPAYGPELDQEAAAIRSYGVLTGAAACRGCGCSEDWACPGGCEWAAPGLCSGCVVAS
jgi:hypothetical protein